MNCYYHPDTIIVATCRDCTKGLCKNCADKYDSPICQSCNKSRALKERSKIFSDFVLMLLIPIGVLYMLFHSPQSEMLKDKPLIVIWLFYGFFCIIPGWTMMKKLPHGYFGIIPLIGPLFYWIIKMAGTLLVGLIYTPFWIFQKINRLKEIFNILV